MRGFLVGQCGDAGARLVDADATLLQRSLHIGPVERGVQSLVAGAHRSLRRGDLFRGDQGRLRAGQQAGITHGRGNHDGNGAHETIHQALLVVERPQLAAPEIVTVEAPQV